jgi:hypothetical protein
MLEGEDRSGEVEPSRGDIEPSRGDIEPSRGDKQDPDPLGEEKTPEGV